MKISEITGIKQRRSLMQDTNAQKIVWKTVSKTGVVAAGGARAVAAGIGILSQGGIEW
jgi:hypothetical protein